MISNINFTCPVCSSSESVLYSGSRLHLEKCSTCGIVFSEGVSRQDYFTDSERHYFGHTYLRRQDLFSRLVLVIKARRRLAQIKKFQRTGRLLEVGSGTGELLQQARNMGFDANGVEYSKTLAEFVQQYYQVPVFTGDVHSFQPGRPYDVIVWSHVLEHSIDPPAELRRSHELLDSNGLLYVAVPNLDCWEAYSSGWGSYEPYHLWYFNLYNLGKLLDRSGFQVLYATTWEPYSAWFNTILRTVFPLKHAALRDSFAKPDLKTQVKLRLVMLVLHAVRMLTGFFLTPLRVVQRWRMKGEELIMIGRKNEDVRNGK